MSDISMKTTDLLEKVYSDDHVSPAEIMAIRDHARQQRDSLASEVGSDSPLVALMGQMDDLAEAIQKSVIKVRLSDYSDLGKRQSLAGVEAYVALIKANFDAFTDDL